MSAHSGPPGTNARRTCRSSQRPAGLAGAGHLLPGLADPRDPVRQRLPTVISQVAEAALGDGPVRSRRLRPGPARHGADPLHRRQHAVHRISLPGQLHRRGFLPAPADDPARASARPQQRHLVLTVAALALLLGGRRARRQARSVLRHRRVHRLLDGRLRHGQVSPTGASGWRRKLVISFAGGAVSLLVVLIFAVVKFTEGAWLVVLLFPVCGWAWSG